MKQRINPLLKASIYYILGNGIGQGVILLGTVIFTRIMTQEDYGFYSTYYSMVSILTTLVGANLFIGLNNAYIDYKNEIHKVRASLLVLSMIVFSVICSGTILLNNLLGVNIPTFMLIMALLHAYSFFIVNYFNYSANMENKYKAKTVFMLLPNILQIVLSVLFICLLPMSALNARIIASVMGVAGCALCVAVYMLKGQSGFFNREYWLYALKISIPSVLSSISYMLMQQSDKIMITSFYDAEETAVYSLIYNVGYILYAVLQATNGVWQAWIYRALDSGKIENVKKVQKWYLVVFAQMAFGLLMISPEMVKILGPETYWEFQYIAPFILGSCLMVMYTFYTTVGLFYKKAGKVSVCVLVAAILNIILNYLCIPYFGGVAAAYTSALSYIVLFFMVRMLVQKMNRGLFAMKYFIVFFLLVAGGCVLFQMVYERTLMRYIIYIGLLLLSLVYMWLNKKELAELVNGK